VKNKENGNSKVLKWKREQKLTISATLSVKVNRI
jgi:hypothetical protein